MSYNERTSARMATLAAKLMHHSDPEVRELAACALTQAPDHPKRVPLGFAVGALAQSDHTPPGAHGVYNGHNAMGVLNKLGSHPENAMANPGALATYLQTTGRQE